MSSEALIPANPDILDGVDDLMQLSYLNEPSVLYNLQYRYDRDMIYVSYHLHVEIFCKFPCFLILLDTWFLTFVFIPDQSRPSSGCN